MKTKNSRKDNVGTCNQRSRGSILTGVTFCYWNILFSHSEVSDANTLLAVIRKQVCMLPIFVSMLVKVQS